MINDSVRVINLWSIFRRVPPAFKGSGRTTLLCINMKWFIAATRGIAIYISFGDEQRRSEVIWEDQVIQTKRDFQQAVAVRVLHRLVANSENPNYMTMRSELDCNLSDMVKGFSRPIPQALELIRQVLGVSESTKIMLAIDEIAHAASQKEIISTVELLAELLRHTEGDEKLFLSVAAYGAVDMQKLCADCHQPLVLQCLPPLYFILGFAPEYANILPEAIRPLFVEDEHKRLPFRKEEDIPIYNRLSKLILAAGGYPRRLFNFFAEQNVIGQPRNQSDGQSKMFAESLCGWLSDEREKRTLRVIEIGADLPNEFKLGTY